MAVQASSAHMRPAQLIWAPCNTTESRSHLPDMHTHDIVVPVDTLRELIGRILMAVGCRAEDAQTTATVLLEADLRGYATHGLLRLPMMVQRMQSGMIAAQAQPRIVTEREGAALVDAGRALGPVGVVFGADLAVRKAKRAGSYTVGVVNSDHIGMAGYYVERIAQAGCVGILAGVTQPLVHPLGGTERLLGTNPLAIAIPGGQDTPPVLLDFATSAIAFGTVLQAKASGQALPEGVAVGPDGQPTTDATRATQGALAPFGGHKGYGLGLVLGLLAGPLLGAKVGKALGESVKAGQYDKGELVIAIDPEVFGDPAIFRQAVAAHIAEIKAVPPVASGEAIRIPGERSVAERARRLRAGVPIAAAVWEQIARIAQEWQLPLPQRSI